MYFGGLAGWLLLMTRSQASQVFSRPSLVPDSQILGTGIKTFLGTLVWPHVSDLPGKGIGAPVGSV